MFFQANTNYDLFEPYQTRGEILFQQFFWICPIQKNVSLESLYLSTLNTALCIIQSDLHEK